MIKLFENQKVSLYEVMKGTGLYAQHLYPYAKGERNIKKMSANTLLQISNYFKIEANEMYNKMLDYQKKNGSTKF